MNDDKDVQTYLQLGVSLADVRRDGLLLLSVKDGIAIVGLVGEPPQPGSEPAFTSFTQKVDRMVRSAGATGATTVALTQREFEVALRVMFPS